MHIKLINIRNAGDENERLLIRVLDDCNLKGYAIVDNTYENGIVSNVNRHVYFFPDKHVKKGNIVRLYTKKGTNYDVEANYGKEKVTYYNFFWGFEEEITVWNQSGDIPYIIHYNEVVPCNFE